MRMHKHTQIFVFSLIILIMGFILNSIISHKIANHIGSVEIYGDYFTLSQAIFILGTIMPLGYDLAVDKFIPTFIVKNKILGYRRFIQSFINVIFKSTCLLIILTILYKISYRALEHTYIENEDVFFHNIIYINFAFCVSIVFFSSRIIRAEQNFYLAIVLYQLLQPICQLLLISILSKGIEESLISYGLSWLFSAIISIICFKFINKKVYTQITKKLKINNLIKFGNTKSTVNKVSVNLLISSSSDYIYSIIVIIVNTFIANSTSVGYAAAIGYFNLIFFVIIRSISSIYKPILMQLFYLNKTKCSEIIATYTKLCIILAIAVFIVILLFGKILLSHIFDPAYIPAYTDLCLFTLGFVLVEGFAIHKITVEMFDSKAARRIVLLTNILSIIIALITSFYSLTAVAIGFIIGRSIFTILIINKFNAIKAKYFN